MSDESSHLFEEFRDAPSEGEHCRPAAPVGIREARASDAERLGRLAAEREGGDAADRIAGFRRALERQDVRAIVLVAEAEDLVIGFGKARLLAGMSPGCSMPEGWYLTGLVVEPHWRRCGVGTRLTEARLAWISERSDRAYYFSNARNRVSIAMHERFGFAEKARSTRFGEVSFVGGEGILFEVDLSRRDPGRAVKGDWDAADRATDDRTPPHREDDHADR